MPFPTNVTDFLKNSGYYDESNKGFKTWTDTNGCLNIACWNVRTVHGGILWLFTKVRVRLWFFKICEEKTKGEAGLQYESDKLDFSEPGDVKYQTIQNLFNTYASVQLPPP